MDNKKELMEKLARELTKKGIAFKETDELGKNVVFVSATYEKKIRHELFYRHSGIYSYKVDIGENQFKLVPMTDEMFYLSWMRAVIEYSFNPKNQK